MKNINANEILKTAQFFSHEIIKKLPNPPSMSYEDKKYVDHLALGCIIFYHDRLREILLESGIDIGEIIAD